VTEVCRNRKLTSGFTLLEIMVVMVIASLILTLVPPLFSGAISGTKFKGATRDLAITLRETRSLAINHNTEQLVRLDLGTPSYQVGNSKILKLPDRVHMTVQVVTGENIPEGTQHVVRFFPDGSSSGEMITLSEGNHAYYLQLNWLTGGITISEGSLHGG